MAVKKWITWQFEIEKEDESKGYRVIMEATDHNA